MSTRRPKCVSACAKGFAKPEAAQLDVPPEVKDTLILKERPVGMQLVLQNGYAPDLDEKGGKDPLLIAAAMAGPDRVVVPKKCRSRS